MLLSNGGVVCRGGAEGEKGSALEFGFSSVSVLCNGESKGACLRFMKDSSSGGAEGAVLKPLGGSCRTDKADGVGRFCEVEFL